MNKNRRKELKKSIKLIQDAISIVEMSRCEEDDCLNNIPDSLQNSDKYDNMEDSISHMEDAIYSLEDAISEIQEAIK